MPNNLDNELARYLFHRGENFSAYEFLGAHRQEDGSVVFRVWAPAAREVCLVSDSTGWDYGAPFEKISPEGIWALQMEGDRAFDGMRYKYRIASDAGVHYKADPYAFYSETLEKNASLLYTTKHYSFTDGAWMNERRSRCGGERFYPYPMNIYEVHLASFMTRDGRSNDSRDYGQSIRPVTE